MARIWQEGFEDGLPYNGYLEGSPYSQQINGITFSYFPYAVNVANGRNIYSQNCLQMGVDEPFYFTKVLDSTYSEIYFRVYFKHDKTGSGTSFDNQEVICIRDIAGNKLISLYNENVTGVDDWAFYAKTSGTYQKVADVTLAVTTWYKIDMYIKIGNGTGAYEVKVDDTSIISSSSDNTGTANVKSIRFGTEATVTGTGTGEYFYFDDIALNDTTGSVNNSWCGSGTIVSLKPKGAGNYSQWDTCEGFAYGESGTNTTTIKITGHGLATNDVIYNKTRDEYRIVTVSDANTLTVSSVTGQTTNDVILMYNYQNTIANTIGTTTNDDKYCVLVGHNLESQDVIVNTTRSNAIRKVIYVDGNNVYIYHDTIIEPPSFLGSSISTMYDGDSIKTFKFKPYAITNHYEAVANQSTPSPKESYIKTATVNDIDTFDMEELVADKGFPSSSTIVAIAHNTYAKELGAGSTYKPVFRISSTDYAGDTVALSGGTLEYQKIYDTSPATSSAWTVSEVDGLEAGVKLV